MLRPEQMSKVSVTGSKRVMDEVIETVHDQNLLHVTDYDGSWEGFDPGDPVGDADEASETLVTVRSIESILDVDESDVDSTELPQHVDAEAIDEELEPIRQRVNELDDERDDIRTEIREIDERLDAMEPFVELGIDLDLLSGYDTLDVAVGEGRRDAIRRALVDADDIDDFEIFTADEGSVLAVFARPTDGADTDVLTDVLVGVEFSAIDIPDVEDESTPGSYVTQLEERESQLEAELERVESEMEELKVEAAEFLLGAEEELSIRVQKTEAPLSFATTKNAFIAEGWIPTEQYMDFAEALQNAVGQHVEIEELERAEYTSSGASHHDHTEGGKAAADGGTVMSDDEPPVVQDNPGIVKPFEVLVNAVSRPKYEEFDPTVVLFLTFPAFFGFMIGDLGYGIVYTAIGWYLYTNFDSEGFKSMGGVTIVAGLFTMLFGILYGEIFGTHQVTALFWEGTLGMSHPPIEKGLSPGAVEWARAWLFVSVLVGIAHLNVAWILDFIENFQLHDVKHAVFESASWILMMNGLWLWIFSDSAGNMKPEFIYTTFSGEPFAFGFAGFSATVGLAGLALFVLGFVLLLAGEPIEAVEFLNVLVNVLSYTRIAAVLLAKAGMAFTVNLLFFGAFRTDDGIFHFGIGHMPHTGDMYHGHEVVEVMFGGLVHGGIASLLGGIVILVLGHVLVLALGVTSAGLQAVRLEYVEFFGKFYEGGGDEYEPFGYERRFTTDD